MSRSSEFVGRLIFHIPDKSSWRLRCLKKHTIDPNWETGTYNKCHPATRSRTKKNMWILDGLSISGNDYPCIRSAFKVNSTKNDVLHFNSYWFNDGEPLQIKPKIVRTIKKGRYRMGCGKLLTKLEFNGLLDLMKKNSFHKYKKGEKPNSITDKDWKRMKKAAKEAMPKPHRCSLHQQLIQIQS